MRISVSAGAACQFDVADFQAVHVSGAEQRVIGWVEDLRM